ncbi:MAG: hypothetical protein V7742_08555 [Halioglobus sp.]
MSFFKRAKASAAISRAEEEAAYAAALREIETGTRRDGLWAKALANSSNTEEAKGKYIKLRVQAYMDERNVEEYVAEREAVEQAQFESRISQQQEHNKREAKKAQRQARELEEVAQREARDRARDAELKRYTKENPLKGFAATIFGWGIFICGGLFISWLIAIGFRGVLGFFS